MMDIARKVYDYKQPNSIAASLRNQRISLLRSLLETLSTPIRILDVGGRVDFWKAIGILDEFSNGVEITLLNTSEQELGTHDSRLKCVIGDARNMAQFESQEFDVVFSNSVIEHVGTDQDQQCMADEVKRVGKRYFVQTPYFYFPIEPHFVFPGFHWLPVNIRVWLATHFQLGWYGKFESDQAARAEITSIQLLTKQKIGRLFPEGSLVEEKFLGLTKSLIVYDGW